MADTAAAVRHPGLILGVARFFHDPRASMRGVILSRPTEGRLLAYAMTAALLMLFGRVLTVLATAGNGAPVLPRIVEQTVSLLFFLPLVYYAMAALGTLIARAFGGTGGWYDGRMAFFWAALVSAPVVLLTDTAGLLTGSGPLAAGISQIGALFFAWALAHCFAEAFGFRSAWIVLGVIVLGIGIPTALAWYLTAGAPVPPAGAQ